MLCYLVVCYPATGSQKPKSIPESMSKWFSETGGWTDKGNMIIKYSHSLAIDHSFEPPVSELLIGLHRFFRMYTQEAMSFNFNWHPEPQQAYDRFLCLLNGAINDLRAYDSVAGLDSLRRVTSPTRDITGDEALHHRDSDGTDSLHLANNFTTIHYSNRLDRRSMGYAAQARSSERMRSLSPRRYRRTNHGDN